MYTYFRRFRDFRI